MINSTTVVASTLVSPVELWPHPKAADRKGQAAGRSKRHVSGSDKYAGKVAVGSRYAG